MHRILRTAYDQKKTLVLTGSNLKSTSKRIVLRIVRMCIHTTWRFRTYIHVRRLGIATRTEIHRNGNVTIIRQATVSGFVGRYHTKRRVRPDRTGTGVRTSIRTIYGIWSQSVHPVLTTKRVSHVASSKSYCGSYGQVLMRLCWEIRTYVFGNTSLGQRWDGRSTRRRYWTMYGHTLHYCGAYVNKYTDYTGQGVDQLKNVIDSIKNDPYGRRHVMSLWNRDYRKVSATSLSWGIIQFSFPRLESFPATCTSEASMPFSGYLST
jgi:hypothetical protein